MRQKPAMAHQSLSSSSAEALQEVVSPQPVSVELKPDEKTPINPTLCGWRHICFVVSQPPIKMKLKDCAPPAPLMFLHSLKWGVCCSHAGFSRKERPQPVATVACGLLSFATSTSCCALCWIRPEQTEAGRCRCPGATGAFCHSQHRLHWLHW